MPDNIADNVMGTSDITIGDNEPSMEDILSSIRKIIAEDKTAESESKSPETMEMAPLELEVDNSKSDFVDVLEDLGQLESASEVDEAELTEGDIVDLLIPDVEAVIPVVAGVTASSDEKDILDLINFVDENTEDAKTEENVLPELELNSIDEGFEEATEEVLTEVELPEIAEAVVGFDESLDLVMDSEASDYGTAKIEAADIETESWKDRKSPPQAFEAEMDDVEERLLAAKDVLETETILFEPQDVIASEPEQLEDEVAAFEELEVEVENLDDPNTIEDEVLEEGEAVRATPDEDMDLVKSLLADLMDEPSDEVNVDEALLTEGEVVDTSATILDDILEASIEDEVEVQMAAASELEAQSAAPESDLARIAREAFEASDNDVDVEIGESDVVDLGDDDIRSKFALVTGGAIAAAGVAAVLVSDDEDLDDLAPSDYTPTDEQELVQAEPVEIDIPQEDTKPEEDETMVRAVKKEDIVDEETHEESSSAFASLANAVQDKTELAENGPAIGDMVKDALRPMLQEWLDKNLRGIVTRAVNKEIKRISSTK